VELTIALATLLLAGMTWLLYKLATVLEPRS
jgi:hypothetical protein